MADVALRGYTQGQYDSDGSQSVAWPAGSAVNHLGVVLCAPGLDKKPVVKLPDGWQQKAAKSDGTTLWVKRLTASDLAGPLELQARVQLLQVISGSVGFGKVTSGESATITANGGALLLFGWKNTTDDLTVSNKIHPVDVVNDSYKVKGVSRKYNAWFKAMPAAGTAYIDTNASAFFAVELLPQTVPFAASFVSPSQLTRADPGAPILFKWLHNSSAGPDAQMAFWLQVKPFGSGVWQYATAGGTGWSTTPGGVVQSSNEWLAAMNATDFPANTYLMEIATSEDGTNFGPLVVSSFYINTKPTLTASATATSRVATVTWVPTITYLYQTWFRVRVTPSTAASPDVPLYDSGVQTGAATTWTVPSDTAWPTNGGSYKAWVEVGQTSGQQTAPTATAPFTVSWSVPSPPTSVVFNTSAKPITITANGLAGKEKLKVTFTTAGQDHTIIAVVSAASMTMELPLAPYGVSTTYTVTVSETMTGVELWSDPVVRTATAWDESCYLVADDLGTWMRVLLHSDQPHTVAQTATVAYGMARPDDDGQNLPFVDLGPEQGWMGTTTLKVATLAAREAVFAFWRANSTFITRWPPEREGATRADAGATRMARVTGLRDERFAQVLLAKHLLEFSWVQQ